MTQANKNDIETGIRQSRGKYEAQQCKDFWPNYQPSNDTNTARFEM
jgi:hypothetical protein